MCNCSKNRSTPAGVNAQAAAAPSQRQTAEADARAMNGSTQRIGPPPQPTGISTTFALQTPTGMVRGSRLEVQAARIRQGGTIRPT